MKEEVFVYTTPSCAACDKTVKVMRDNGIIPTVIDITKDKKAHKELVDYGYMSVPVIAVGTLDKSWTGFTLDAIIELAETLQNA